MRIATSSLETKKARSLDDALSILAAEPRMPIAGATDVYVGLNFGTLHEKKYVDIWACSELREIAVRGNVLSIGALATYTDMIRSKAVGERVPMLVAGDEMSRTQNGNNNAYCQDNELSWVNWEGADQALIEFTRKVIDFRLSHPAFCRRKWFQGQPI